MVLGDLDHPWRDRRCDLGSPQPSAGHTPVDRPGDQPPRPAPELSGPPWQAVHRMMSGGWYHLPLCWSVASSSSPWRRASTAPPPGEVPLAHGDLLRRVRRGHHAGRADQRRIARLGMPISRGALVAVDDTTAVGRGVPIAADGPPCPHDGCPGPAGHEWGCAQRCIVPIGERDDAPRATPLMGGMVPRRSACSSPTMVAAQRAAVQRRVTRALCDRRGEPNPLTAWRSHTGGAQEYMNHHPS